MTEKTLEEKLREFLQKNGVSFEEMEHAEATTCEESARERGRDMAIGGKTLLLKGKKNYHLFTLSALKKIDSNKMRKILKTHRLRFASKEELWELTGAVKGALPPFGHPVLPFDLYVDKSIVQNREIAFNAGVLTKSFLLDVQDYLDIANPKIEEFSKDPH